MKHIIIGIICLLATSNLFAQSAAERYSKIYEQTPSGKSTKAIKDIQWDADSNVLYLSFMNTNTLVKMDMNGNIIAEFSTDKKAYPESAFLLTDTFIYYTVCVGGRLESGINDSLYIVKLDKNLNIINEQLHDVGDEVDEISDAKEIHLLPNGNLLALYSFAEPLIGAGYPTQYTRHVLAEYATDLSLLSFNNNRIDYTIYDFIPRNNGAEIITVGALSIENEVRPVSRDGYIKFDNSFDTIWDNIVDDPSHNYKYLNAITTSVVDTNHFITVGRAVHTEDRVNRGIISKFDTDGSTIFRKMVGEGQIVDFKDVVSSADGNIWVVGRQQMLASEPMANNRHLFRLDAAGDIIWDRYLSHSTNSKDAYLNKILPLPDGRLLLGGSIRELNTVGERQEQAWLLLTDSMGCINDSCYYPVSSKVIIPELQHISLYPNPTKAGMTTLDLSQVINRKSLEVIITDLHGRLISSKLIDKSQSSLSIDLSAQAAGIYFVKVSNSNGERVFKLMKE